jgi:hypothetical protein
MAVAAAPLGCNPPAVIRFVCVLLNSGEEKKMKDGERLNILPLLKSTKCK